MGAGYLRDHEALDEGTGKALVLFLEVRRVRYLDICVQVPGPVWAVDKDHILKRKLVRLEAVCKVSRVYLDDKMAVVPEVFAAKVVEDLRVVLLPFSIIIRSPVDLLEPVCVIAVERQGRVAQEIALSELSQLVEQSKGDEARVVFINAAIVDYSLIDVLDHNSTKGNLDRYFARKYSSSAEHFLKAVFQRVFEMPPVLDAVL